MSRHSGPPPVDPEVFLLLLLAGAVAGAMGTAFTYLAFRLAEREGRRLRILPEFPPIFRQQEEEVENGS